MSRGLGDVYKRQVRSDVVDISSGVEYDDVSVKGKDESKVKAFIQNAKF